jgi:hypothetical protein|tara:strand:+ start:327 stop:527 length:201 start_codon:yes stop_codon:yes gene_type:complete
MGTRIATTIATLFLLAIFAGVIFVGPKLYKEAVTTEKQFVVYKLYVDCVKLHPKNVCDHIVKKLDM